MISFAPTVVFIAATGLALVSAGYFWSRSKSVSIFIILWYLAALALNRVAVFPGAGVWVPGDLFRLVLYSTAMFVPVLAYILARVRSVAIRQAIDAVPLPYLAASQIYRVVGAFFFLAYLNGVFPAQVAVPAAMLDTFIGLTALPLAMVLARRSAPGLTLGWNALGLFDFTVALTVISGSLFGLLTLTPAPSAIGQAPWILLSVFQVPFAIIVHVEMLRRLAQKTDVATPAVSAN